MKAYAKPKTDQLGMQARDSKMDDTFMDLLKDTAQNVTNTLRAGEQISLKGAAGQADATDVAMAVNEMEVTLQAVVAVRDRFVGALQEILRMPI